MLDELERLEREALLGPWTVHQGSFNVYVRSAGGLIVCSCAWQDRQADAQSAKLIAAARNALPALLRLARAAQQRHQAFNTFDAWMHDVDAPDDDGARLWERVQAAQSEYDAALAALEKDV